MQAGLKKAARMFVRLAPEGLKYLLFGHSAKVVYIIT